MTRSQSLSKIVAIAAIITAFTFSPEVANAQFQGFFQVGMTGSSFRGGNLSSTSPIFRLAGGGGIRYRYATGFEFETGLNYAVKGSELEGTIDEFPIIGVSEITYVELPVLIGYRFNSLTKYKPRIVAGPSMAFMTDARITFHAPGSDFEQSESDDTVEDRDLGLLIGADIIVPFKGESLTFGVRSVLGFSNARSEKPELYNTSFGLYGGIVF